MHYIDNGFRSFLSTKVATATVGSLFGLFFAASVFAGVLGSAGPTYPTTVNVGDTNIPVSMSIVNNSTAPQDTENILVTGIFHTPSCASDASSVCQPADVDPGVFQITGPVTGRVGTACAGTTFSVSAPNITTGEVQFTPNTPIILSPSNVGGAMATCLIDFQVNVLMAPTKDSSIATGIQTSQLAKVSFQAQTSLVNGTATGSSQITVAKASPTISTIPSNGGSIGTILNDTATLSGGLNPTGSVTFRLFSPSDLTCVGAAVYTDVDPSAPYATSPGFVSNAAGVWNWTADYSGDANNNPASSLCGAESVTIVPKGNIIVDKITNPVGDPAVFSFNTTGTGYSSFTLTDVAAPNNQSLDAGTYSVSEAALSGWNLSSATCVSSNQDVETASSISLQAGETVTCTFTNTKVGRLIVQKTTLPAGDTTNFSILASGSGTITGSAVGSITDATDYNYEVTPGTYSVAETVPAGWVKTGDTCQNVVVAAGETKTCVITNTKNGHIIIVKDSVPNSAQDFVFTNNFNNGNPATFSLDDDSDVTLSNTRDSEVLPGTFAISEGAVSGWTQTSVVCSDQSPVGAVVVSAGEIVTCTFTNTLQAGHIIVQKTTLPAGDTTNFSILASGSGTITGSAVGSITDATDYNYEVTPGTYSVAETVPAGWVKTGDTCQNVVVAAGETKTCVITNTKNGVLIVDKVTNPIGNTTSFSILASGTGTIIGGGTGSVTDVANMSYVLTPGTYSVSETLPSGWTQTSNTCNGIVVGAGETKTCVITNTQVVQYCSPGYWKQSQHFDSYVTYSPTDLFSTVFGENITILWSAKGKPMPVTNPTLLQVLEANGGGISSLARAAVGALLNASALQSGYTPAQIISMFQAAYPGSSADYEALKASYTAAHNCPLN